MDQKHLNGSPDIDNVQKGIEALNRLNLKLSTMDEIDQLLKPLFDHLRTRAFGFGVNYPLYRAVTYLANPGHSGLVSFRKDTKAINEYGRCNDIGEATFYCCTSSEGALNELGQDWRNAYVGIWRVNERLMVNNVGYTNRVKDALASEREFDHYISDQKSIDWFKGTTAQVYEYLSDIFTRKINSKSENHLYKLSAAIHRSFTRGHTRGLLFPSIANNGNYDNVAIKPEFISEGKLTLVLVNRFTKIYIPEGSRKMKTRNVVTLKDGTEKVTNEKTIDVTNQLDSEGYLRLHTATGIPSISGKLKWFDKEKIGFSQLVDENGYLLAQPLLKQILKIN